MYNRIYLLFHDSYLMIFLSKEVFHLNRRRNIHDHCHLVCSHDSYQKTNNYRNNKTNNYYTIDAFD